MRRLYFIINLTLFNFLAAAIGAVYFETARIETPVISAVNPIPKSLNTSPIVKSLPNKTVKKTSLPALQSPPPSAPEASFNPTPSPAPAASADCLIVIDGQKYNVTDLRSRHSGGDIFQCGTDMTAVFYSRHDQSTLAKMSGMRVD